MTCKILSKEEVKIFNKTTSINAKEVLIIKNNRYYYAVILDNAAKVQITPDIANKFI